MITYTRALSLNVQPGGRYTVTVDAAGNVMSVNESGGVETRAPGTAGPWEVCSLVGSALLFTPVPGKAYLFLPVGQ